MKLRISQDKVSTQPNEYPMEVAEEGGATGIGKVKEISLSKQRTSPSGANDNDEPAEPHTETVSTGASIKSKLQFYF